MARRDTYYVDSQCTGRPPHVHTGDELSDDNRPFRSDCERVTLAKARRWAQLEGCANSWMSAAGQAVLRFARTGER